MSFTIDKDRKEMFEVEPLSQEEIKKEEEKSKKKKTKKALLLYRLGKKQK